MQSTAKTQFYILFCGLAVACGPVKKSRLDSVDSLSPKFNGKSLMIGGTPDNTLICVDFSADSGKCTAIKKDAKGVLTSDVGTCDLQIDAKQKYFALSCTHADGSGCLGDSNGILINGTDEKTLSSETTDFKDIRIGRTLTQAPSACATAIGLPTCQTTAPAATTTKLTAANSLATSTHSQVSLAGEAAATASDTCDAKPSLPEKLKCKWQGKEIVIQNSSGESQCYQFSTGSGACKVTLMTAQAAFREGPADTCDLLSGAAHSVKIQYAAAPRTIAAIDDATLNSPKFQDTTNAKITIANSGYCAGDFKAKKDPTPVVFAAPAPTTATGSTGASTAPQISNSSTTTAAKNSTSAGASSASNPLPPCKPAAAAPVSPAGAK